MASTAKVVLVNGSFGVGKSTVARALRAVLPGSSTYDPEPAGIALWKVARWVPLRGSNSDDFQDMPAWRRATVWGSRALQLLGRPVIVPMTFDDPTYFHEVWRGIRAFDPEARAYCLVATHDTIRARLARRGTNPDGSWIDRRVQECLRAHDDDRFGVRIDTESRSPDDVAGEILARLGSPIPAEHSLLPRPSTIRSERLELVTLLPDELRALVLSDRALASRLVGAAFPSDWPTERAAREGLPWHLEYLEEDPGQRPWRVRVMVTPDSRQVIGSINCKGPPDARGEVEIGWGVEPPFRRHGYAAEAAAAVKQWAFAQPGVSALVATISDDNHPSQRVAMKLGMRITTETRLARTVWRVRG